LSYLFLFPLFTFVLSINDVLVDQEYIFPLWVVGFGIGLDCFRTYYYQVCGIIDPYKRLKYMTKNAINAIDEDQRDLLNETIIQTSEASYLALRNKNIVLPSQIISEIKNIACYFLNNIKCKHVHYREEKPFSSPYSYENNAIVASFCSHLVFLYHAAAEIRFEDTCNQVITSLSVISLYSFRLKKFLPRDESFSYASNPLTALNQCQKHAQKHDLTGVLASLVGAMKAIMEEVVNSPDDYPYVEEEIKEIVNILLNCADNPNFYSSVVCVIERMEETFRSLESLNRDDFRELGIYLRDIKPLLVN